MSALKKIIALTVLLSMLFTTAATAFATEHNTAESQAVFEFTAENEFVDPTPPVDPEYPIYIIDPDKDENGDNGVTGNTGLLRIDYVSNFKFGKQPITAGSQQFYASLISAKADHTSTGEIQVPNFVQVSDLRGTAAGWTLSVKQNDYFKVSGGQFNGSELKGARVILDNISANTAVAADRLTAANQTITFDVMDEYYTVMSAEKGQGNGTHVAHFGDYQQGTYDSALSSVILDIPAHVSKLQASYKTSFTWTLSNVPDNSGNEDGDEDGSEIDDADEGDIIEIDGIDWIILSKDSENKIIEMITKDPVAERIYYPQEDYKNLKWSTSDLRNWLRTDFKDSLSPKLSNMIIEVSKETTVPGTFEGPPNGSLETQMETVYLLSKDEYTHYLSLYPFLYKCENYWWLRSPYLQFGNFTAVFSADGQKSGYIWQTDAAYPKAVRPVITICYKNYEK